LICLLKRFFFLKVNNSFTNSIQIK
jgi:hypothetical protein